MLAILHSLGMFVADLLKSRCLLEAENLFLRYQLSIALRRAPPRLRLRGRKGVLEGFVERLFLAPMLIAIAIVLMRFAFRIGNHVGFCGGADDDLQGYDANFGALIDERSPFLSPRPVAVQRTHGDTSIGSSPTAGEGSKLMRGRGAGVSITATPFFTDFCTFSKARTPIWRTRSRETPNSSASSLSVIGSSASRAAAVELLACGEERPLVGMAVHQAVLPLAGITVLGIEDHGDAMAKRECCHLCNSAEE